MDTSVYVSKHTCISRFLVVTVLFVLQGKHSFKQLMQFPRQFLIFFSFYFSFGPKTLQTWGQGGKRKKAMGGIQGVSFNCKIFAQFLTPDILLISVVEEKI